MRKETCEEITRKLNAAFPDSVRTKTEIESKWWALKAQGRENCATTERPCKEQVRSPN